MKSKSTLTAGSFGGKLGLPEDYLPAGILAQNVYAKWNDEDNSDAVNDISFEIKQGECYGICGSVGDGKVNDDNSVK